MCGARCNHFIEENCGLLLACCREDEFVLVRAGPLVQSTEEALRLGKAVLVEHLRCFVAQFAVLVVEDDQHAGREAIGPIVQLVMTKFRNWDDRRRSAPPYPAHGSVNCRPIRLLAAVEIGPRSKGVSKVSSKDTPSSLLCPRGQHRIPQPLHETLVGIRRVDSGRRLATTKQRTLARNAIFTTLMMLQAFLEQSLRALLAPIPIWRSNNGFRKGISEGCFGVCPASEPAGASEFIDGYLIAMGEYPPDARWAGGGLSDDHRYV